MSDPILNFDEAATAKLLEMQEAGRYEDSALRVTVEVGSTRMLVREVLQFGKGSVIDLDAPGTSAQRRVAWSLVRLPARHSASTSPVSCASTWRNGE